MFFKVAIVHDWLVDQGGGEKVLSALLEIYPDADLYSTVCHMTKTELADMGFRGEVNTSFIQKLPRSKHWYRKYFPLMPIAVEQFDLSHYNLIISSSSSVAKGVITGPDQTHICYCHSPMRYAWDMQSQYLRESNLEKGVMSWLARYFLAKARNWDVRSSFGVDHFIANSNYIARRIKKIYRRNSTVIYPPVDIDKFDLIEAKEDFFLTCSRLVPYKRVDLIVEAFNRMPDKKLIVIGSGPELENLTKKAKANVKFLGRQPFSVLKTHMEKARAFIYAAEEDFGIVPVEAQAAGTPVIAFGKGGALETVDNGITGLHFYEQTPDEIVKAVQLFNSEGVSGSAFQIRQKATTYSLQNFLNSIKSFVEEKAQ